MDRLLLTLLVVTTTRISPQLPGMVYAKPGWLDFDASSRPQDTTTEIDPEGSGQLPVEEANTIPDDEKETLTTTPFPSPTEPTIATTTTTYFQNEGNSSSSSLHPRNQTQFFQNFANFERKSRSYMNNMKNNLLTVLSSYSKSFHQEVQQYILRFPSSRTIEIKKYSRDTCDCDGVRMSPCPLKCLYSCYASWRENDQPEHYENCRYTVFERCKCYEGAHAPDCDRDRTLDDCFTTKTETIPGEAACQAYKVDDKNVSKSFDSISEVLVEPVRRHFRGIETELQFLKETSVSVDHMKTLVGEMCSSPSSQEEPTCRNEAADTLKTEISMYHQIKNNITKELLSTQEKIRNVYGSFKTLKEQHFTHIAGFVEKYACCQKTANFSIPNFDCTTEAKLEPKCSPGQYECRSGKCIPITYLCDGGNDCPQGEDENYCTRGQG